MPKILYGMQVADAIDQFTLKQFTTSGRYNIRGIPTLSIIQMDEDDITFRKISAIQNTAEPLGIKTEVIRTKEDGTGIRSIIEDVCSNSNNSFVVVGDSRTRNNARMWTDDMSGHVAVCDLDAICYTTLKKFYAMHHPHYAPAVAIAILALLRYYKIDLSNIQSWYWEDQFWWDVPSHIFSANLMQLSQWCIVRPREALPMI